MLHYYYYQEIRLKIYIFYPTGAQKPQFPAAPAKPPVPPMPAMPSLPQQPLISGLPSMSQPSNQSLLSDLVGPPISQPSLVQPLVTKPVPDLISGVKPPQPMVAQPLVAVPNMVAPAQPVQLSQPISAPLVNQLSQPLIQTQPIMNQIGQIGQNPPLIPNLPEQLVQATPPVLPPQPLNRPYASPPESAPIQPLGGTMGSQVSTGSLISSPPSTLPSAGGIVGQPITSTPLAAVKSDSFSKPGKVFYLNINFNCL